MPDLSPDYALDPNFFNSKEAVTIYDSLYSTLSWQHGKVFLFGKWIDEPRLMAWFGEKPYTYSKKTLPPKPFDATVLAIKTKVELSTGYTFNTALVNLYRDGLDSMGWHSDDEPELGINPVIASVNLGAARWFHFKHKNTPVMRHKILLTSGSLLLMKGDCQHMWLHALPKSKRIVEPRINITFRLVHTI